MCTPLSHILTLPNKMSAHPPVEQQRRKSSHPRRCISTMAAVKNMVSSSGCATTSSTRRGRRPGPAAAAAAADVAGAASGGAESEEAGAGWRPRRRGRWAWLMVDLCVCAVDQSSVGCEREIDLGRVVPKVARDLGRGRGLEFKTRTAAQRTAALILRSESTTQKKTGPIDSLRIGI